MMQLMLPDYPVIKGDGIRGAIRLCPRVKLKRRAGPPEGGPYPAFLDTSATIWAISSSRASPSRRAAVDVASWLRDLGLERYEAAFRENDVDGPNPCCQL